MSWLYTKEKQQRLEAEAHARGEDVAGYRLDAPDAFRWQLWYALERLLKTPYPWGSRKIGEYVVPAVCAHLREAYGRPHLVQGYQHGGSSEELKEFVVLRADTDELMDVINVVINVVLIAFHQYGGSAGDGSISAFVTTMRRRFGEHKMAYDIVENRVVDKASEELHTEVVAPAVALLAERSRFAQAESQYRDALDELSKAKWADAVTDANATVEVVLKTILDRSDGQLPGLLGEARKRGLFGDVQEVRIKKFVDGLTALADVRNKEGDAHGNSADRETAWLAVHWAGALTVFLVERAEAVGMRS